MVQLAFEIFGVLQYRQGLFFTPFILDLRPDGGINDGALVSRQGFLQNQDLPNG